MVANNLLAPFFAKYNEKATHIEDTQILVTEIEMRKVVLYLVRRNGAVKEEANQRDYTTCAKGISILHLHQKS
jgi:hypothetical protein